MGFAPLGTWKYRFSVLGIGLELDRAVEQFGTLWKSRLFRGLASRALGAVTARACTAGSGSPGGHGHGFAGWLLRYRLRAWFSGRRVPPEPRLSTRARAAARAAWLRPRG
jgi:hypothetical protein